VRPDMQDRLGKEEREHAAIGKQADASFQYVRERLTGRDPGIEESQPVALLLSVMEAPWRVRCHDIKSGTVAGGVAGQDVPVMDPRHEFTPGKGKQQVYPRQAHGHRINVGPVEGLRVVRLPGVCKKELPRPAAGVQHAGTVAVGFVRDRPHDAVRRII